MIQIQIQMQNQIILKKISVHDYLFNTIPELFVKYSVGMFRDEYDENEFKEFKNDDIETILKKLYDLIEIASPIKLNENSRKTFEEFGISYFSNITEKL